MPATLPDDYEDIFTEMTDGLVLDLSTPFAESSWEEIIETLHEVTQRMKNLAEFVHPRTEEGRQLHETYNDLQEEIRTRSNQ